MIRLEQQHKEPNSTRDFDPEELKFLKLRGAFDLPPKAVQDELITTFFRWVAPILPIINQREFLIRYNDPLNQPSILLLQAIFLSVSRVSRKLQINNEDDTTTKTFLRRAKALHDASYEQDPVVVVQSLILMSWYWHGPQDIIENGLFYWSRLAIAVAQGNDMHRIDELSLTVSERRLWKRIWWTLFTRDRSVSAAYGRPVSIQSEHSNVGDLTEDDFKDDEAHVPNCKHVQFFLQYVKLCKVLDMVACTSVRKEDYELQRTFCEIELSKWQLNCPEEMQWQQSRHEFWPAVLQYTYNTILCQLYGLQPFRINTAASQAVVSDAASMILSIIEFLVCYGEVEYAPPSVLYSIFTVLVTVKDQLSSALPSLVLQSQRKVRTCIQILDSLSHTWPIAQMIGETSELVFSEERFYEMLKSASSGSKRKAETDIMISRPFYKRTALNSKQARPQFMLPRSRVILKMDLTNKRSDQRSMLNNNLQSPQSRSEFSTSGVCSSDTKSTTNPERLERHLPVSAAEAANEAFDSRTNVSAYSAKSHQGPLESEMGDNPEVIISPFQFRNLSHVSDEPFHDSSL